MAYGLENFVDFISSLVVLWRFYCPHEPDAALLASLQKREERASVAISIVIGMLGIFVFTVGIVDMLNRDEDTDLSLLFTISFVSIIVFGSLTIMKFKYAQDLDSPSLYKDGICSLIGTCLSASLLLTTAIIDKAPGAWVLDPIVSLLIGICATIYGFMVVFNMVKNGVPIFAREYWITNDEKESDTATSNQELPSVEGSEQKTDNEEDDTTEHEMI